MRSDSRHYCPEDSLPIVPVRGTPDPGRLRTFARLTGWQRKKAPYGKVACRHWLLHKNCTAGKDRSCPPMFGALPEWPIFDHPQRFIDHDDRRVLLLSPYWFSSEHATELTEWCNSYGLIWFCNGFTHLFPGRSVSITIMAAAAAGTGERLVGDELPWPDNDPRRNDRRRR